MESRIRHGENKMMKSMLESEIKESWIQTNNKIKATLGIREEDMIIKSRQQIKELVKLKTNMKFHQQIIKQAENKSKMQFYLEGKKTWKVNKRAEYMNALTRNQVSTIFKARTRMLDIKDNFKGKYTDQTCRKCRIEVETQDHVLKECQVINQNYDPVTKEMIFDENPNNLKIVEKMIRRRMDTLNL